MKKTFYFFLLSGIFFTLTSFFIHPYHVGSMEYNYNSKSKTFEITGKFFTDDLENALSKELNTIIRFHQKNKVDDIDKALKVYVKNNLKIKINNQFVMINYLGFEENNESIDIYLETEKINSPTKVEVSNSFLYNLFDDQMNIHHIIIDGNRKTFKLNYPDRYQYFNF